MSPPNALKTTVLSTLTIHRTGFSLAVYAIVCAVFYPSLRFMISADTLNYISVAELYASGQWSQAVNAFWSPAYSWLLVPFITAGVNGVVAVKIVNIVIGALILTTLSSLAETQKLEDAWTTLLLVAAVPFVASSAFLISTPDVLVVLVLTVYLRCLLRLHASNQTRMGALVGIIGFAGYLSKFYLFLFLCFTSRERLYFGS